MGKIILTALIVGTSLSAQAADPGATLWKALHDVLAGPEAANYWEHTLKYAVVPGLGVRDGFQGTVILSEPSNHPTIVKLAMYGTPAAEVTIKLSHPSTVAFAPGTAVRFQGIATEFSARPFDLTIEVEQDKETFISADGGK